MVTRSSVSRTDVSRAGGIEGDLLQLIRAVQNPKVPQVIAGEPGEDWQNAAWRTRS